MPPSLKRLMTELCFLLNKTEKSTKVQMNSIVQDGRSGKNYKLQRIGCEFENKASWYGYRRTQTLCRWNRRAGISGGTDHELAYQRSRNSWDDKPAASAERKALWNCGDRSASDKAQTCFKAWRDGQVSVHAGGRAVHRERSNAVWARKKHLRIVAGGMPYGLPILRVKRSAALSEISGLMKYLGQVIAAQRDCGGRIDSIVLMGIGEPLDNYAICKNFFTLSEIPADLISVTDIFLYRLAGLPIK